jgi:hypothetical protein
MKRSVESLLSQDPTTTPEVEVQILTQSQAEIIGIETLKIINGREVVAFRRDGEDQVLEAVILPDIDKSKFLHDGNYMNEVLLKAEGVLKDSGK